MLTTWFSFHEILYKEDETHERSARYRSKYSDCKIGWRNPPVRSQNSLNGWIFNKDNGRLLEQLRNRTLRKFIIPFSKGYFSVHVTRDNPEGKSLLEMLIDLGSSRNIFKKLCIGIEETLAGFPVLQSWGRGLLWNEASEHGCLTVTEQKSL